MERMACVNLPAFPLQLLLRLHPDWTDHPVAVVDKDTPQGVILWVNKLARRHRILPGMRYAKGLSLATELRAGAVRDTDIDTHVSALTERLRFFTPHVEPSKTEPGVFWLDASGLSLLHPSLKKWAGLIGAELSKANYYWSVAVGFSRYGTYASARAHRGIHVYETPDDERRHARTVPIVRLDFDPGLRDALEQLGVTTLGGFVDLPEDGIRKRFGADAHDLYKLARNEFFSPIDSRLPVEPFAARMLLDHPETSIARLMPGIETLLGSIIGRLERAQHALTTITLTLTLDNGEKRTETLHPASPTLDLAQIRRLIELRLHHAALPSGVVDLSFDAGAVRAGHKQLELFTEAHRRDLGAADRAFAQLRAEFGDNVVMKATLRDGHLPEACFEWEPMEKLSKPAPRKVRALGLARRIFAKSIALVSASRVTVDGRLFRRIEKENGPNDTPPPDPRPPLPMRGGPPELHGGTTLIGPYIISGGWWTRKIHREYYFVRNDAGQWLWIYYDRRRKQSFLQGQVG
jgi:protein ImuB